MISLFLFSFYIQALPRYTPAQSVREENPEVIYEIRHVTSQIAREDDGKATWFAAVGVSPLIFAADLESRGAHVLHFPISSLGQVAAPESPEDSTFWDVYFGLLLKPAFENHASRIVFFDFGLSGISLETLRRIGSNYCARNNCEGAELRFVGLSYDRKLPFGARINKMIRISLELDNLLMKHHFDYLRRTERQTTAQWRQWLEENKMSSVQNMRGGVSRRLTELALTEGKKNYAEAVEFFKATRPAESFFDKLWRRCAELLNPRAEN